MKYILLIFIFSFSVYSQDSTETTALEEAKKDSNNFFIISAIKSISGIKPSDEFFDLNAKFYFQDWLHILANFDVSLATDTSGNNEFSEAAIYTNFVFLNPETNKRSLFGGIALKLFDSQPFFGVHIGSIENVGIFQTSYTIVSFIRRFYLVSAGESQLLVRKSYNWNLFIEGALHSKSVPFLQDLRIKVSLLLPLNLENWEESPNKNDIASRVVIEIPLGHIVYF